jgi:hypothetical protein
MMSDEKKGAALTGEELDEIARLGKDATPGPWESDTDGAHSRNGEDLRDFACGPSGELFDTGNATDRELHHEPDDDGGVYYFDPIGRANVGLACTLRNAAPALLESARLARIAAELFREHGEAMANSLAARAREARDMHGAFTRAAELDRAHTALESTIAAFRKGAE